MANLDKQKATDLFIELDRLTNLYPGLSLQLKAIEEEYDLKYGYEKLKEDFVNFQYEVEMENLQKHEAHNEDHKSL